MAKFRLIGMLLALGIYFFGQEACTIHGNVILDTFPTEPNTWMSWKWVTKPQTFLQVAEKVPCTPCQDGAIQGVVSAGSLLLWGCHCSQSSVHVQHGQQPGKVKPLLPFLLHILLLNQILSMGKVFKSGIYSTDVQLWASPHEVLPGWLTGEAEGVGFIHPREEADLQTAKANTPRGRV